MCAYTYTSLTVLCYICLSQESLSQSTWLQQLQTGTNDSKIKHCFSVLFWSGNAWKKSLAKRPPTSFSFFSAHYFLFHLLSRCLDSNGWRCLPAWAKLQEQLLRTLLTELEGAQNAQRAVGAFPNSCRVERHSENNGYAQRLFMQELLWQFTCRWFNTQP